MSEVPLPRDIRLHRKSRTLELVYGDQSFELTAEFLRVHSPSAEVRGHGIGQEVLQSGKKHVGIRGIEPTGNYALKISFDDGHDSRPLHLGVPGTTWPTTRPRTGRVTSTASKRPARAETTA